MGVVFLLQLNFEEDCEKLITSTSAVKWCNTVGKVGQLSIPHRPTHYKLWPADPESQRLLFWLNRMKQRFCLVTKEL